MTLDTLLICRAGLAERLALEALQWRASLVSDEYREALIAHPDAIQLPAAHITEGSTLVANLAWARAGFVVVLRRPDVDADLDGLFIEPALWRRGIGTRLVQAAEILAASCGARCLHVMTAPQALAFYGACGFRSVGETQTRFG